MQGTRQELPSGALAPTEEHIQGETTNNLLHLCLQHEEMWYPDADFPNRAGAIMIDLLTKYK